VSLEEGKREQLWAEGVGEAPVSSLWMDGSWVLTPLLLCGLISAAWPVVTGVFEILSGWRGSAVLFIVLVITFLRICESVKRYINGD
jgi:hypothetical protein